MSQPCLFAVHEAHGWEGVTDQSFHQPVNCASGMKGTPARAVMFQLDGTFDLESLGISRETKHCLGNHHDRSQHAITVRAIGAKGFG